MPSKQIVVIGASSGGVPALQELVRGLPADLGVPVFVVQHISNTSISRLPDILNRAGRLLAFHPEDNQEIVPNRIHVAPADYHLVIEDGRVRVQRGPEENRHRPSIDVLFRSAARAYGAGVIGVVLTGFLDDGTNGLITIKQRGGMAIVQDPENAFSPGMPQSAVERVDVDYVLPLAEIAPLLVTLVSAGRSSQAKSSGPSLKADQGETGMPEAAEPRGKPSTLTCPDCHGALWELEEGDALTYRCRVGHAYSADSMYSAQAASVERALWAATRSLEESAALSRRLAKRARERTQGSVARLFEERAQSKEEHANVLREVLRQDEKRMPRAETSPGLEEKSA